VKSILGEFSFGVSICRSSGTQSDLGAPFACTPRPGGTTALPPALRVGNLFTITGRMNCALSLAGGNINQFYPKILTFT